MQVHLLHRLEELESLLKEELDEILRQEEVYWQQKSRITWLKEGERSANFFHKSTLILQKWNKILR